ncbi:MAG: hypothetical protein WCF84_08790 [Anaerolineae bacterium]
MNRQIFPVGIAIAVGLIVLVSQFAPNDIGGFLVAAAAQVAAFAVLLGFFNVLLVHTQRILRRDKNAWSSAVILVTAIVVLVIVLPSGGASDASDWIFRYLYRPLEASFLALVVFFIGTAAYRALRVRTWDTALLVISALVVLVGSMPLINLVSPLIPVFKDWVVQVPAVAGIRGIAIGVALGAIATGLRLLTGIDRPYSE